MRAAAVLVLLVMSMVAGTPLRAEPFETKAPVVLMIDAASGMALLDKDSTKPIEPASMAKLMTMAVVLDALNKGETSLTTLYPVSEFAWRTGGAPSGTATMFAAVRSNIRVIDLLRGLAVHTANDACLILAEGLSGNEAAFVERMNALAKAIGLTDSRFVNATGLPAPGQVTTARDLARLATWLRTRHPAFYSLYRQPDFNWNKIFQKNRNPIVSQVRGGEGLVAGGTKESGFGLVGSVVRDGRRILLVIAGMPSTDERLAEATKLIDWGFSAFSPRPLFKRDAVVGSAKVFGGVNWSVPVATAEDVFALVRTDAPEKLEAALAYEGPLQAPVTAGQIVGELRILRDGVAVYRTPVRAVSDVPVGDVGTRAMGAVIEVVEALWYRGVNAF